MSGTKLACDPTARIIIALYVNLGKLATSCTAVGELSWSLGVLCSGCSVSRPWMPTQWHSSPENPIPLN